MSKLQRSQVRLNQIKEIQDAFCNTSASCVNGSCMLCLYHKSNLKEFETWFKEHLNADKKP